MTTLSRGALGALLALGAVGLCACPGRTTVPLTLEPATVAIASDTDQGVLGPLDVVWIRVYDEPELTDEYQIEADGTLDVPFVGPLQVSGLTPREAADQVEEHLSRGFLANPVVTIMVKESNSRLVFVLGEVKSPGSLPFVDGMTVIQAIAMAGGVTSDGAPNRMQITRTVEGEPRTIRVQFQSISRGKGVNVLLMPNDVITVPPSPI
jgi:polysaccharide export outer membrane protein